MYYCSFIDRQDDTVHQQNTTIQKLKESLAEKDDILRLYNETETKLQNDMLRLQKEYETSKLEVAEVLSRKLIKFTSKFVSLQRENS